MLDLASSPVFFSCGRVAPAWCDPAASVLLMTPTVASRIIARAVREWASYVLATTPRTAEAATRTNDRLKHGRPPARQYPGAMARRKTRRTGNPAADDQFFPSRNPKEIFAFAEELRASGDEDPQALCWSGHRDAAHGHVFSEHLRKTLSHSR
jgi:hypothetical protein